jgi:AraC-like DNA-binding protein
MDGLTALNYLTRALVRTLPSLTERCAVPPEGPWTEPQLRSLWAAAPVLAEDEDVGLHLAQGLGISDLGILPYLAHASATVGEGFVRVVRFQTLAKDTSELQLLWEGGTHAIVERPGQPWPRALAEAVLATWLLWPQRWAGPRCRPARVRLQYAHPAQTDTLERVFGCPLEFEAPHNALLFSPEAWDLPLSTADPRLLGYLEVAAAEEAKRLRSADPLLERLEQVIVERLPSGNVGVVRVARALETSPRSLHRQLQVRGLTYRGLLDTLRNRAALELLQKHNVSETAFLLGFSDPSGLRRAYQRWTGQALRER